MNTELFAPAKFAQLYNCSGRTFEEWHALGVPNVAIGVLFITFGVIYWSTYLPFMVVFIKSDLLQYSCYKIMFLLGLVDCLVIPLCGFYCGWASITGVVYCMYPRLEHFLGHCAISFWATGSSTCMLLAFNRCVEITSPRLAKKLFAGRRTYFWFIIPLSYFYYFWFVHPPTLFTSILYAFFMDPLVGTPERRGIVNIEDYPAVGLSVHNLSIVVFLPISYCIMCISLYRKSYQSSTNHISNLQVRMTVQAIVICSVTLAASLIYVSRCNEDGDGVGVFQVTMQFVRPPFAVVILAEMTWFSSHGMVGIIYLIFNRTMRREAYRVFCKGSGPVEPDRTNQSGSDTCSGRAGLN